MIKDSENFLLSYKKQGKLRWSDCKEEKAYRQDGHGGPEKMSIAVGLAASCQFQGDSEGSKDAEEKGEDIQNQSMSS